MTSTGTKGARRTQQERVKESSRLLLSAAIELIAERGYERTTTAEITRKAGLSNSMVQIRYGSKEALLEALLRSYEDRMFKARTAPDSSGHDQLLGQIEALVHEYNEDPQLLRAFLMIQFETAGAIPQLKRWQIDWLQRYIDHIADTIRRGQADGSIRSDLDPAADATFFMDVGTGALYRWILNPDETDLPQALSDWAKRMNVWFAPRA